MLNHRKPARRSLLFSSLLLVATLTACSDGDDSEPDAVGDNNNSTTTTIALTLDANQQVPVTDSAAVASGNLILVKETGALSGSIQSTGMSILAAHIHEGEAGRNGDVVVELTVDGNTVSVPENTVLNAEQGTRMLNGEYYINLHSALHPGGEIRGQITPEGIEVLSLTLNGDSEIPPLSSNGSGTGYVTLRDDDQSISIAIISTTDSPAAAAHLHAGFAGENGDILIGLEADAAEAGRFEGAAALAAEDYDQVKQGGSYLNLHTQAVPGGELRGQLLPQGTKVFTATLSGEQEVPSLSSTGSGEGYLTLDTLTNTLTAIVRTNDLSDAVMAHVHAGARGENGDVIVGLEQNAEDPAVWAVRGASIGTPENTLINEGNTYFNVHTATHPSGELRGQIIAGQYASVPAARVRAGSQEFVRIFINNSGAELAPFYTENATLTLPGQATVTGRNAISEAWQGAFTQGGLRAVRLTIDSIEMGASPEEYVEQGRYSLDVETESGIMTLESTYVVTWSVPADGSQALIIDDQINP